MVSWGPYISARVLAKFSGLTQGLDFWLRSEMTDFGLKLVKDFKMWAAHYQKLNPPPPPLRGICLCHILAIPGRVHLKWSHAYHKSSWGWLKNKGTRHRTLSQANIRANQQRSA